MTLVLALASEHQVHMTCDFKLTDARTGAPMSVDAHKLVRATGRNYQAIIGVTGPAHLDGTEIGSWLAAKTGNSTAPPGALDDLFQTLTEAEQSLAGLPPSRRKYGAITFVVAAMQGSQAVIALLSNYQNLRGNFLEAGSEPRPILRLSVARPSSPRLVVAGAVNAVRKEERKKLERLLRLDPSPQRVRAALANLNQIAAGRTDVISKGCNAATELATGVGESEPFLVEQQGDFIPPEVQEMLRRAGIRFRRQVNDDGTEEPIVVKGSTSSVSNPSPEFFREQFKLRPNDSDLWNNYGAYLGSRGRHSDAVSAFRQALDLNPKNYLAAQNLGVRLWRSGQVDDGRRLLGIAGENPDENYRRESLSLTAELLSQVDGDLDRAEDLHRRANDGPFLASPATRYGHFLFEYRVGAYSAAEELYEAALRQEPMIEGARLGKASCQWRLHGSLASARALIRETLDVNRNPESALTFDIYLSLIAGEYDYAGEQLSVLSRKGDAAIVEGLKAYHSLYVGEPLESVEEHLRRADYAFYGVDLAAVKWVQGDSAECNRILAELEPALRRVDLVAAARVVRELVDPAFSLAMIGQDFQPYRTQGWAPDLSVLLALGRHSEVEGMNRDRIAAAVRAAGWSV